jgi:hypothetical protein
MAAAVALAMGASLAAQPASRPASSPADGGQRFTASLHTPAETQPQRQWGRAVSGIEAGLPAAGGDHANERFACDLAVRNVGRSPVELKPDDGLFGWFLISQGTDRYFTEKVPLVPQQGTWPEALAVGDTIELRPVDLSGVAVFAYDKSVKVVDGYPQRAASQPAATRPAGALEELLLGPMTVRFNLCVPGKDGNTVPIASNPLSTTAAPPDLAKLSPQGRERFAKNLIRQFSRDSSSAQQAHDIAVKMGKAVVDDLLGPAADPKGPEPAQAWLVITLADLGDERAAPVLAEVLRGGSATAQSAVAYHGPKLRSKSLDQAIIAAASSADKPALTAWATLGFAQFAESVPGEVLRAGVAADDERKRTPVVSIMAAHANAWTLPGMVKLLGDGDPKVRIAAADVMSHSQYRGPKAIAALTAALDTSTDPVRVRIVNALENLTGRRVPYDPKASEAEKKKVIEGWKQWRPGVAATAASAASATRAGPATTRP